MLNGRSILIIAFCSAGSAQAHIMLEQPTGWIVTNGLGDPQKEEPCGTSVGTASNVVTTLQAGSKITVRGTETVFHPGHFRLAIARERDQLITPVPVVQGNDCKSAPIQAPAIAPVLLDGLLPRSSPSANGSYQQELTVPDIACDDCTLQLLQFMSSHWPACACGCSRNVEKSGH